MKNLTKKQKITYVLITIIILAIIGTIIGIYQKNKKVEKVVCSATTEQQIKEEEVTNELPKDYKGEVDIVEEEIEVKGKDGKVEKKVVRKAVPKGQGKGKVVATTNTNKMNTTKPNTNNTTNKPTQKPNTPNTTKPNTTKPKPVYKAFEIRDNDKRILWVENGNGGKVSKIGFKDGTEYEVLSTRKEYEYFCNIVTKPVTTIPHNDGSFEYVTKKFGPYKSYEEMDKETDKFIDTDKYEDMTNWWFNYVYYYTIRQIAK